MTIKDPGLFVFVENENNGAQITTPSNPQLTVGQRTDAVLNPSALYEYSLGIKDIQARYISYGERQAYVSKVLDIPGNVMEIELDANEEHPVFDEINGQASARQTSVEYYISYKAKPNLEDWIPLLPKGQKQVLGERLFFFNGEATLRFPAKLDATSFFVYANGLKLAYADITFLSSEKLMVADYSDSVIYTVDYIPDSYQNNPWIFRLNDYKQDIQRVSERFDAGTAFNNTLTLTHHPYVDLQKVLEEVDYNPNTSDYRPVEVRLVNASIQGRNRTTLKTVEAYREDLLTAAYTYNRTLYRDKSWSKLEPYRLNETDYYGGFDYYHWKNQLTFTEQFNVKRLQENLQSTHGNATIEVHYDTLVSQFRLKTILRRNAADELTATPKVTDYQLRFKTME